MTRAADAAKKARRASFIFGLVAFVPHPAMRGLFMKTHACVDMVACPTCRAAVYEPCRSVRRRRLAGENPWKQWTPADGWTSDTHYPRRNLALRGGPDKHYVYSDARGRRRNRRTK